MINWKVPFYGLVTVLENWREWWFAASFIFGWAVLLNISFKPQPEDSEKRELDEENL